MLANINLHLELGNLVDLLEDIVPGLIANFDDDDLVELQAPESDEWFVELTCRDGQIIDAIDEEVLGKTADEVLASMKRLGYFDVL